MQNVMVDIETLGTKPGCAILSIGAVEFDNVTLGKSYEVNIDAESCVEAGLTIEPSTFMWWMDQSDEARKALTTRKGFDLATALLGLSEAFDWKNKKVWCNGASFDFPIIEAGYTVLGAKAPWQFWNLMDFRTLKNLVDTKTYKAISDSTTGQFVAHSAVDDAKRQALHTIAIMRFLRGE